MPFGRKNIGGISKMDIKISIIVPVYNVEKYLPRCVASLRAQTLTDIEIILVDDGSPDGCPEMCDRFAAEDKRIRVIHKPNGGVSDARNAGISAARGEYVTFVDSDDYVEPDAYRIMLDTAAENSCDVVMCDCVKEFPNRNEVFSQNIPEGFYDRAKLINEYFPKLIMQPDLTYPPAISNCLLLIRTELIKRHSIKYPAGIRISEDLFFGACVMYRADSFFYLKKRTFYHYFVANTESATKKADIALWDNYKRLISAIENEFGHAEDGYFTEQLGHAALFFALNTIGQTAGYPIPSREKRKIAVRIAADNAVKTAAKTVKSLSVPKKLKYQTLMLGSRFTARLLMDYLIFKHKK